MHEEWLSLSVERYKTPNIPRHVGGIVSLASVLHNHPTWEIQKQNCPKFLPKFF